MNALKGWRTIILNLLAGLPPLWDTLAGGGGGGIVHGAGTITAGTTINSGAGRGGLLVISYQPSSFLWNMPMLGM